MYLKCSIILPQKDLMILIDVIDNISILCVIFNLGL
jgi:hypothetical protein